MIATCVIAAIVIATRGAAGTGGRSRDELVKATVAALAKGDADTLVALGDPAALDRLMDCMPEAGGGADLDRRREKLREQRADSLAKTKGLPLEVVEITQRPPRLDANGKNTRAYDKGQKIGTGCTAKIPVVLHRVDAKVKLGGASQGTLALAAFEAEGSWYLVDIIGLEPSSSVGAGTELAEKAPDVGSKTPAEASGSARTAVVGTAGSAATSPAPAPLAVGDRVMARWTDGDWYSGKITAVRPDGTYDVVYKDGDTSKRLPASKVRKPTKSSSASGRKSSSSAGETQCIGPGFQRRCNGVCVNIQDNNDHCGECNHRCPSDKTCQSLFCRDAEGHL